jgi:glycosyltransferase involved in cell wall biosynthesis
MSGRRRVLHIFSGDLWAGAEVMIHTLFEGLVGDRDVELVALSLNDGTLSRKLDGLGFQMHVIPETGQSFAAIAMAACGRFRRDTFDVIHSHRVKQNCLAVCLSKVLRVRNLIATLHGLPEESSNGRLSMRDRLKGVLDPIVLGWGFATVVVVSGEMHERMQLVGGAPPGALVCIHNGIRIPQAVPSAPPGAREGGHIGSVGRLVPVKDFDLFLETAAAVSAARPETRFSILGDGPLREPLLARARALGLQDTFAILPPSEDPWPFYASLDVYLNTSVHEGLPLSILEAMACERPVVAPRVGGIPEIVEDGEGGQGLLPRERSSEGLARSCLDLLADPERGKNMGRRGRERVRQEFSSARMVEAYKALYLRPAGA